MPPFSLRPIFQPFIQIILRLNQHRAAGPSQFYMQSSDLIVLAQKEFLGVESLLTSSVTCFFNVSFEFFTKHRVFLPSGFVHIWKPRFMGRVRRPSPVSPSRTRVAFRALLTNTFFREMPQKPNGFRIQRPSFSRVFGQISVMNWVVIQIRPPTHVDIRQFLNQPSLIRGRQSPF